MESAKKDLQTRLTQLQMAQDKTEAILSTQNSKKDSLQAMADSKDLARRYPEKFKIAEGEVSTATIK